MVRNVLPFLLGVAAPLAAVVWLVFAH